MNRRKLIFIVLMFWAASLQAREVAKLSPRELALEREAFKADTTNPLHRYYVHFDSTQSRDLAFVRETCRNTDPQPETYKCFQVAAYMNQESAGLLQAICTELDFYLQEQGKSDRHREISGILCKAGGRDRYNY